MNDEKQMIRLKEKAKNYSSFKFANSKYTSAKPRFYNHLHSAEDETRTDNSSNMDLLDQRGIVTSKQE